MTAHRSEVAALQSLFSEGLAIRLAAAVFQTVPGEALLERFSGDMRLNAKRLAVYANNLRASRMRAIEVAYPIIRKIVGEEFFNGLAREYAKRFDASDGDLNWYGDRFAQFVATFQHTRDLPYLPDVARMEWLAHRAYYAEDTTGFDVAQLGSIPTGRHADLVFTASRACALITSDYPLAAIWEAHRPRHTVPPPVDFAPGPHYALIYRPEFDVLVIALHAGEYGFLDTLVSGSNLGLALERALIDSGNAGFDVGAALGNAVARKALTTFRLETT